MGVRDTVKVNRAMKILTRSKRSLFETLDDLEAKMIEDRFNDPAWDVRHQQMQQEERDDLIKEYKKDEKEVVSQLIYPLVDEAFDTMFNSATSTNPKEYLDAFEKA